MGFIIRASSQGCCELISTPFGRDECYSLRRHEQHGAIYELIIKGNVILTFYRNKLSVDIFCEHQIFIYKEEGGGVLVFSSLEQIVSSVGKNISPDIDYFIDCISCGATPRVSTRMVLSLIGRSYLQN